MNFISRIFGLAAKEQPTEKKERLSIQIKRQPVYRTELAINRLDSAILIAEDVLYPQRLELLRIYKEVMRDLHLLSQVRTARYTVQQSKFMIVNSSETEVPALHNLLESKWFTQWLDFAIDAELYGHSLIEFSPLNAENRFSSVSLIPREHVCPEYGFVRINPQDTTGISYRETMSKLFLTEVGEPYDLGLLMVAAREVIWKYFSLADWSRSSEKYGMPLLVIRTSSTSTKELDAMEAMAQGMGSNGYVILNKEDEAEVKTLTGSGDFFKIYENRTALANSEISKLINGQTMTSDDGSSQSQANVHERILNSYTRARLQSLQNTINTTLFPFLVEHGYPLAGMQFRFHDILSWYADKEPEQPAQPENQLRARKKKAFRTLNIYD